MKIINSNVLLNLDGKFASQLKLKTIENNETKIIKFSLCDFFNITTVDKEYDIDNQKIKPLDLCRPGWHKDFPTYIAKYLKLLYLNNEIEEKIYHQIAKNWLINYYKIYYDNSNKACFDFYINFFINQEFENIFEMFDNYEEEIYKYWKENIIKQKEDFKKEYNKTIPIINKLEICFDLEIKKLNPLLEIK